MGFSELVIILAVFIGILIVYIKSRGTARQYRSLNRIDFIRSKYGYILRVPEHMIPAGYEFRLAELLDWHRDTFGYSPDRITVEESEIAGPTIQVDGSDSNPYMRDVW